MPKMTVQDVIDDVTERVEEKVIEKVINGLIAALSHKQSAEDFDLNDDAHPPDLDIQALATGKPLPHDEGLSIDKAWLNDHIDKRVAPYFANHGAGTQRKYDAILADLFVVIEDIYRLLSTPQDNREAANNRFMLLHTSVDSLLKKYKQALGPQTLHEDLTHNTEPSS